MLKKNLKDILSKNIIIYFVADILIYSLLYYILLNSYKCVHGRLELIGVISSISNSIVLFSWVLWLKKCTEIQIIIIKTHER